MDVAQQIFAETKKVGTRTARPTRQILFNWKSVYNILEWKQQGIRQHIHDALVRAVEQRWEKADTGGGHRQFVGKNDRKRHIVVDTLGLLIAVVTTHTASIQYQDGAALVWQNIKQCRRLKFELRPMKRNDGGFTFFHYKP
jgi:hypothetical protein